ncbi:MAG: hypothetical protein JW869_03725 [Candidatus Omnitrophica bacterium]|nr:hypothetical protein [Candidatus Omnitrophota bacterium]
MSSMVIAIAVAIWFYITGKNKKQNPLLWVVIAIPAYYIPQIIIHRPIYIMSWNGVIQILNEEAFNFKLGLFLVLVGLVSAYLVNRSLVHKNDLKFLEQRVPLLLPAIIASVIGNFAELFPGVWGFAVLFGTTIFFFVFAIKQGIRIRRPLFCSLVAIGVIFVGSAQFYLWIGRTSEVFELFLFTIGIGFLFGGLSAFIAKKKLGEVR